MSNFWLFLIIFLEGYAVLSSEILFIRQLIPFVGNDLESVSIIISAVLVPLSFGYYFGGNYNGPLYEKLRRNFIIANLTLILGLSYNLFELYFAIFSLLHINHHMLQTSVFALIFIVYPIFLLGQTIPLLSNYIGQESLAKTAGKILFISTLGSFTGSILNSLVIMPLLGVNYAVIFTIACLALVGFILEKKLIAYNNIFNIIIVIMCIMLNAPQDNLVSNNAYSTISVFKDHNSDKILSINRSASAKVAQNPQDDFEYAQFIEQRFINAISKDQPLNILILGAGGFTLGRLDTKNYYTYVDIDRDIKDIAEKHFLPEALGPNKTFIAQPARAFVKHNRNKYDLIIVDLYTHQLSIPFQVITEEFFTSLKDMLQDKGIITFNFITSPNFANHYSIKLDNTLRKVFGNINREVVGKYNGWQIGEVSNIIYSYFNYIHITKGIYTDNNNSSFYDK